METHKAYSKSAQFIVVKNKTKQRSVPLWISLSASHFALWKNNERFSHFQLLRLVISQLINLIRMRQILASVFFFLFFFKESKIVSEFSL